MNELDMSDIEFIPLLWTFAGSLSIYGSLVGCFLIEEPSPTLQ